MFRLYKTLASLFLFWLLICSSLLAGPKDPVEGEQFHKYVELQDVEIQSEIRSSHSEEEGFIVTGPLDANLSATSNFFPLYSSVRVICPSLNSLENIVIGISVIADSDFKVLSDNLENSNNGYLTGYRGSLISITRDGHENLVQYLTLQQLRFLIWAKQHLGSKDILDKTLKLGKYAVAVSDYLYQIDLGYLDTPEPKAVDFGLDEKYDLYAPAPDYVISGYQNYKDYLKSHAEIITSNLSEILAFVPTASGLDRLKSEAPDIAYPNKEFRLLQEEFRKFIRRGGKMDYMRTLTKEVFDTLKTAEYFFAVGMSGKVRFGRELLREEVKRIEAETGQKPARANHAFLFVGEPILTAGAFFIENDGVPKIVEVNTQSGHYFYSNITATIREDVAERSNEYFLTIGHFFRALDSLEIDYQDVLLRKL